MDQRKMMAYAVAAAVLITAAVIFIMLLTGNSARTPEVVLPVTSEAPEETGGNSGTNDPEGLIRAEVNVSTVQAVISKLSRPDSYSRTLTVGREEGQKVWEVQIWVRESMSRIRLSDGETAAKNLLITDKLITVWYDGDDGVYTGPRSRAETQTETADAFSMMMTYEDLLLLEPEDIIDARFAERDGRYYICVTTEAPFLGYVTDYEVCVATGLLDYAETRDGDTVIYRMSAVYAELSAPPDEVFTVPQ